MCGVNRFSQGGRECFRVAPGNGSSGFRSARMVTVAATSVESKSSSAATAEGDLLNFGSFAVMLVELLCEWNVIFG